MYVAQKALKKPRTYDEQLAILRDEHGLIIDNEARAKDILTRVNYYRFSAYGISLRQKCNGNPYIAGATIEHIYSLYRFDTRLRQLLLALIEPFEIELRSVIAYVLATRYGAECYLDVTNFDDVLDKRGKSVHAKNIERLVREISHSQNKLCVRHHIKYYGGRFPIWAAIELLSFGSVSSLYSIMRKPDQKEVSKSLKTRAWFLDGQIQSFVDIRNRCAHYDRLYNTDLAQIPSLMPQDEAFLTNHRNRIFAVILSLRQMTKDRDLWEWFYYELQSLLLVHPEVELDCIGFSQDWEKALKPKE